MMGVIEEMEKQDLSKKNKFMFGFSKNQKTGKYNARFVEVKEPKINKFKYWFNYNTTKIKEWLLRINKPFRYVNSEIRLLIAQINVKQAGFDALIWIMEAMLEGLTANFATHFLFGVRFDIPTILAHGILIKQGTDIYHTLRKNDSNKQISPNK